jgi:NMD protein affecting ribosome stability and mRNA decay
MASRIECPRCGELSANFVQGVCRACYMRDYHQRRSAAAVTPCPRCGIASANFVQGVCRACYMRDYHQRRSAAAGKDVQKAVESPTLVDGSEGQRLCVECKAPGTYARGLCLNCYMRERQRRHRQRFCVECGTQGIYSRGLCRNCYVFDSQHRRQRFCVECGVTGTYARGLCQNCYMRDLRRQRRIKHRACVVCGVSFQSARRDALYCSPSCGQKAHRADKVQLLLMAAHADERGAVQSATATQDPTLAARIEVQAHAVAGLDQRLGQIDSTIEQAAKRGRTDAALSARDGQWNARQVLPGDPQRKASTLADFKAERATLGAKGKIEAEAAPIRHVAEPIGAETDGEWAIRWLLALMMLCCDAPALSLTGAASAPNRAQSDAA